MSQEQEYNCTTEEEDFDMEDICWNMRNPAMLNCPDEEGNMLVSHDRIIKAYLSLLEADVIESGIGDLANFLQKVKAKHREYLTKITFNEEEPEQILCSNMLSSSIDYISNVNYNKRDLRQLLNFLSDMYDKLLVYA